MDLPRDTTSGMLVEQSGTVINFCFVNQFGQNSTSKVAISLRSPLKYHQLPYPIMGPCRRPGVKAISDVSMREGRPARSDSEK